MIWRNLVTSLCLCLLPGLNVRTAMIALKSLLVQGNVDTGVTVRAISLVILFLL